MTAPVVTEDVLQWRPRKSSRWLFRFSDAGWRNIVYAPIYTGLRPLCLPCTTTKPTRSPLKAQRRPKGRPGCWRVTKMTFTPRHGLHGRGEVLSVLKIVAQRSPMRSVAHRSLKGSRRKAHASPWSRNGCTGVGHWSHRKNAYCCKHCVPIWAMLLPPLCHPCASFVPPITSIERSLWRPLCLHSATLGPPWQWFCIHSASLARPVVPLQQWWLKEHTRVVLQQLHRNRTFWVWATTERPGQFSGRSEVARRSQPCVKRT